MTIARKPKQQSPVLLRRAKLLRPRLPGAFLGRPRLFTKLAEATNRPVTLVIAPGGYGKSVLLASWVAEVDCATAWLSLDPADNDLRVWAAHLLASIEGATQVPGIATRALVEETATFTAAEVATALTSDILDFGDDLVLVLDDLHGISDESVHECLVELIRHPLPMLHLVIASREEPSYLPLPLLRAREQMLEIRVPDLRFSAVEVEKYFDQAASGMREERFQQILDETDGWPAGLSLTAMAVRNGSYVERGSGSDRIHAMDFLFDEMLARQAPDVQAFLIATSIVERVSGELAAAILGPSFGDRLVANEMLERLARSNEFVVRLGDQREWYSYHHLFRELLRRRLVVIHSLEQRNDYHLNASAWYDSNGEVDAAIDHALHGGTPIQAARVVERHGLRFPRQEGYQAISRWLSRLPAALVAGRPGLQAVEGWRCYGQGQQHAAQRPVRIANALLAQGNEGLDLEMRSAIEGHIAILSAFAGWPDPSLATRNGLADIALAQIPPEHEVALSFALFCKGIVTQALGRSSEAIAMLAKVFDQIPESNPRLRWGCLSSLCEVWLGEGNLQLMLRDATLLVAISTAANDVFGESFGNTKVGVAHLLLGDPMSAISHLQAVRPVARLQLRNIWRDAMVALQLSLLLVGRTEQAGEVGDELIDFLSRHGDAENLSYARSAQARCALVDGRIDVARQWLTLAPELIEPLFPYRVETDSVTRLRIRLALGSDGDLRWLLAEADRLLKAAMEIHSRLLETELRLLAAVAHLRLGHIEDARTGRAIALKLAAETGFVLPFIELRRWIAPLFGGMSIDELFSLPEQLRVAIVGGAGGAAHRYSNDGGVGPISFEPTTTTEARQRWTDDDQAVEILTGRELDVLAYMSGRMSNKEIANELSISPLTVKRHVSNILEKLEVGRRSQAVERARSLGIIRRPLPD